MWSAPPPAESRAAAQARASDATAEQDVAFVLKLGRALNAYGTPAHRLEESMARVSEHFELDGQFFSSPTAIFSTFEIDGVDRTYLQRIHVSEVDLGKLGELDALTSEVLAGRVEPTAGIGAIDSIHEAPARYSPFWTTLAFGVASGAAAVFFRGGLPEVLLSFANGLLIGLLARAAQRSRPLGRLFEAVAAALVSFSTLCAAHFAGPINMPVATLAGLIALVPGLTLTVAISELATRNLLAGTARFAAAMMVFLLLGFGVALGSAAGSAWLGPPPTVAPAALPYWSELAAFAAACLSFTVLFQAPLRDLGWITVVGALGYGGVRGAGLFAGPELGVFAGALLVGVGSNLSSRLLDRPAMITRVPAMMLLVPGGLGFLSVASLLEDDVTAGVQTAFSVALIAVSLVAGLLVAAVLLPPRKPL